MLGLVCDIHIEKLVNPYLLITWQHCCHVDIDQPIST